MTYIANVSGQSFCSLWKRTTILHPQAEKIICITGLKGEWDTYEHIIYKRLCTPFVSKYKNRISMDSYAD